MAFISQYKQVLRFQTQRIFGTIIVFAVVQIIMSLGIAIGFTYLYSDIDRQALLYLATGAPTIVVIITGLVILPVQISNARMEGHGEFLRTLPVNRLTIILADTTIWLAVTIPGTVLAILATGLMFRPGYAISPWFIPAYLLCILTSIGVGYGFAYLMPPMIAMAFSQVIAFAALMFSPINFPMERLPVWLQVVHTILPIDAMARVIRASLATTDFQVGVVTVMKLIVWCFLGYWASIKILNRK